MGEKEEKYAYKIRGLFIKGRFGLRKRVDKWVDGQMRDKINDRQRLKKIINR